jgi:hypothetical protein
VTGADPVVERDYTERQAEEMEEYVESESDVLGAHARSPTLLHALIFISVIILLLLLLLFFFLPSRGVLDDGRPWDLHEGVRW